MDFRWDQAARTWWERFPRDARGAQQWQRLFERNAPPGQWRQLLSELRRLQDTRSDPPDPVNPRPCVFVSHRMDDADRALRIANIAHDQGFDYWVDVLDPVLLAVTQGQIGGMTAEQEALLTASVIEMGLLNSTHVIVVLTEDTRGSMWVPYEYGRVKTLPLTMQAGCWVAPKAVTTPQKPEYLVMGVITKNEPEIAGWFAGEVMAWGRPCPHKGPWPHAPTTKLPS